MHLPELPTIFVKGGEERKVYFTVQARELLAAGWKEKGEVVAEPKKEEVKTETKPRVAKTKADVAAEGNE